MQRRHHLLHIYLRDYPRCVHYMLQSSYIEAPLSSAAHIISSPILESLPDDPTTHTVFFSLNEDNMCGGWYTKGDEKFGVSHCVEVLLDLA